MTANLKEKLLNGEKALGAFINIYSPSLVEMIGYAGYDFIVIDDEHGAFSYTEIENMIRSAELVDLVPIVRVSYDPSSIQKALDRGAKGIQVPMVNTKEDAERVVKKAKFPPLGERGASYATRATRFGKETGKAYLDSADESLLTIVHIETPEAVENFEEIMSVPGIDLAFIGATDLSVSMGYKAEGPSHRNVQEVIKNLYERAEKLHVLVGTVAGNSETAVSAFEKGAAYVGVVSTAVISNSLANIVKASSEARISSFLKQ